jgi:hypothetical protein
MKHLAALVLFAVIALAQPAPGGRGGNGKAAEPFAPRRLADGHPDFGGIWMAASLSAAFNVEEHGAKYGTPAGPSVIVDPPGGKLPYLPKNAVVMFYAWMPGSYITWHTDYLDKNSMSVYLHRECDPNHGGYFCWQDWGRGIERHDWRAPPAQCQMALPRFNSYVYMDDAEWHTVTMTTPNAPPRLSLQMFFGKGPLQPSG